MEQRTSEPTVEEAHGNPSDKPSFKTCGVLDENMRITDRRWPAVREAARRLVREHNIVLQGPDWLEQELHELSIHMGDRLPSRTTFPTCLPMAEEPLTMIDAETNRVLVLCSFAEPHHDVVWIPLETHEAWQAIKSTAMDLIDAGYPGCIGCAGAEAEQPWDEKTNRENLRDVESNGQ